LKTIRSAVGEETRSTKSEIRNSNDQMTETAVCYVGILVICACLGFRDWDFGFKTLFLFRQGNCRCNCKIGGVCNADTYVLDAELFGEFFDLAGESNLGLACGIV